jgi:predicted neutral ceramidase superfamily lipid hydrolase
VKSIFLVIGACGGAAKLNQTVRSSMTQDEVLPRPSSVAWLPVEAVVLVPGILVLFVVTALVPGSLLLSAVTAFTHILSAAGFVTVVAVDEAAPLSI